MTEETVEIYEFEGFRLNVTEHFLIGRDGERLQLSEKAFETLCVLVRNSGHLVKKSDLLDQVWADSFVEENNLNKCIYTLRRGLGETNGGTLFIETVKKHGFRFVPDVHRVSDNGANGHNGNGFHPIGSAESPSKPVSTETDADRQKAEPRRSKLPIYVLSAVLLLGAVALAYFFINRPTPNPVGSRSIAVLPFKPINTANRDELLEVGIADSLIHQLNAITGLVVRPLNATRAYTEIGQDPVAAGREQKVSHVLASNYQLADGRIRITSQLINVATGQVEESYKFDKEAAGVFAIQDAVTVQIGNKLIARFGSTAVGQTAKRGTNNEDAYQLYLDGMYFYDKRGPIYPKKSVEKMEQAVKLDPNYALAWAGKALAHLGSMSSRNGYSSEEYQSSIEAVDRALALDPNLSAAHSASCKIKKEYEHDRAGAERECKRALELDPNSSIAHQIYSHLLMATGRPDEAITAIKTAMAIDPTSYFNQRTYANLLYYARRYDDAVVQYKQVIEMGGDQNYAVYDWIIRPLEMQGKEAEAFEWFIQYLTLRNQNDETIGRFRTAYQASGWQGVLLERERTFDESFSNYFRRAAWNASLGNKDKAFEYLEISFQRHNPVVGSLTVEPIFDPLRDDPRYADLARRLNGQ